MTASTSRANRDGISVAPAERTYTVTFGRTLVDGRVVDNGLTLSVDSPTLSYLQRAATPLTSNPVWGEYSAGLVRGDDSNGEYEQVLTIARPGNLGLPEHAHPDGEEHVELIEGTVVIERDGEQRTLRSGASMTIEAGTPHTIRNESKEVASWVTEIRPADALEATLRTLGGLAHDGKLRQDSSLGLLQAIVLVDAVGDGTVFTSMSASLQRYAAWVVAPLSRVIDTYTSDKGYGDAFWIAHVEQPPELRRTP